MKALQLLKSPMNQIRRTADTAYAVTKFVAEMESEFQDGKQLSISREDDIVEVLLETNILLCDYLGYLSDELYKKATLLS